MGCDCACARGKDIPRKPRTSSLSVHSQTHTNDFPSDVLRRLSRPISSLFRLGAPLFSSESGSLYLAYFLTSEKPCCIRAIHKQDGRLLLQQRIVLTADAERLLSLDHPFILRTYEAMEDDKNFYLVSEAFAGKREEGIIATEDSAATLAEELLGALEYCSQRGITHGRVSLRALVATVPSGNCKSHLKLTAFAEFDSLLPPAFPDIRAPESQFAHDEKIDVWHCAALVHLFLFSRSPLRTHSSNEAINALESLSAVHFQRSPLLFSFLKSALAVEPAERLSLSACRNHPWILSNRKTKKSVSLSQFVAALRKLQRRNVLQHTLMKFVLNYVLPDSEIEAVIVAFLQLDQDGDGVLGKSDLIHCLQHGESQLEEVFRVERILLAAEANNSGSVSFSEFAIATLGERKLLSTANLNCVFRFMDPDSRGKVSMSELRSFFAVKPESEKDKQWNLLLLQAAYTENDNIDFFEFLLMVSNISSS